MISRYQVTETSHGPFVKLRGTYRIKGRPYIQCSVFETEFNHEISERHAIWWNLITGETLSFKTYDRPILC